MALVLMAGALVWLLISVSGRKDPVRLQELEAAPEPLVPGGEGAHFGAGIAVGLVLVVIAWLKFG
jgi:hypothetical protein